MSLVPLRLEYGNNTLTSVIWENPRPCSPKNCLPIMFEYAKESKDKILSEFRNIKNEIKKLKPSKIKINDTTYYVEHQLMCTMVDGKVCQHLTETSSAANCIVCGAKPSEMNNLSQILHREEKIESFSFGLQVLHLWIRLMECVLNISYRIQIKKWSCGLIVDTPKQGTGSSNDGNTARRFFQNYETI